MHAANIAMQILIGNFGVTGSSFSWLLYLRRTLVLSNNN